jgi:hypothetical protein
LCENNDDYSILCDCVNKAGLESEINDCDDADKTLVLPNNQAFINAFGFDANSDCGGDDVSQTDASNVIQNHILTGIVDLTVSGSLAALSGKELSWTNVNKDGDSGTITLAGGTTADFTGGPLTTCNGNGFTVDSVLRTDDTSSTTAAPSTTAASSQVSYFQQGFGSDDCTASTRVVNETIVFTGSPPCYTWEDKDHSFSLVKSGTSLTAKFYNDTKVCNGVSGALTHTKSFSCNQCVAWDADTWFYASLKSSIFECGSTGDGNTSDAFSSVPSVLAIAAFALAALVF